MANLLTMFQELSHYWNELGRGEEKNVLCILEEWEKTRQQWLQCYNENEGLKSLMKQYEHDVSKSRQEQREIRSQLIEARSQIAALVAGKQAIEHEKDQMENQIEAVRDVLKDMDASIFPESGRVKLLEFREKKMVRRGNHRGSSFSIISENDVSYDNTEENIVDGDVSHLRNGRPWHRRTHSGAGMKRSHGAIRPSAPPLPENEISPPQKKRSREGDEIMVSARPGDQVVTTTTLTVPMAGGPAMAKTEIRRTSLNRSFSEPHLPNGNDGYTPRNAPPSGLINYGSASSLHGRRHMFLSRTVLRPEYCDHCGKRIAFGKQAFKCQECKTTAHAECREDVPLPCVPRNTTPSKRTKGIIADFVSNMSPMIPHLIVRCITEIERRGLDTTGLYRVPGSETQVVELTEKLLWGKGVPNLTQIEDVHVLCGTVKRFLSWLKEPLITFSSWHDFTRAADLSKESDRSSAIVQAVNDLPQPNRDTLAYIMLHLIKVGESSSANKMPISNLARVFGPNVVGFSVEQPQPDQMMRETEKQFMVMNSLFEIPIGYWDKIVDAGDNVVPMYGSTTTLKTPQSENRSGMRHRYDSESNLYPNLTSATTTTPTIGPLFGSVNFTPTGGLSSSKSAYKVRTGTKRYFNPPWK